MFWNQWKYKKNTTIHSCKTLEECEQLRDSEKSVPGSWFIEYFDTEKNWWVVHIAGCDDPSEGKLNSVPVIVKDGTSVTVEFGNHRDAIIGCDSIRNLIETITATKG